MERKYIRSVALDTPVEAGSYLHGLPAVRFLERGGELAFRRDVTFLVGENGTGKSTLLEGIAAAFGFNPEGGTLNFSFSTNATHSTLYRHLRLSKAAYPGDGFFFRAESFYNAASYIDEVDAAHNYGGRSLHKQSHGESFLALVEHRFSGRGLYLLDEPEAALSPARQLTLLAHIHALTEKASQFIIATHSPLLMACPGAEVLLLTDGGVCPVDYRETEHYQITRRFLENPDKMLRYLWEGETP